MRSSRRTPVVGALVVALVATLLLLTDGAAEAHSSQVAGWGISRPIGGHRSEVCTAGVNAINARGTSVVITAGHCGATGTRFYSQHSGGQLLGVVTSRAWSPRRTTNDWALIRTDRTYATPARLRDGRADKDVVGLGRPRINQIVCMTGRSSGTHCGRVLRASTTGLIVTTIRTRAGDSGAPLFVRVKGTNNVKVLGILSAGNGRTSYFQPLGEVLAKAHLRLKTRR